jgi:trehalose 6-phosphate phosphatase
MALPGTLLEHKNHGLVVHYRRAPSAGPALKTLVDGFVAEAPDHFEVLESAMAWEIRPRGINKGGAVERLMARAPFAGRVPVFIGDDVTDRDGCRVAVALGGYGLMVPEIFPAGPVAVRAWLSACADRLSAG